MGLHYSTSKIVSASCISNVSTQITLGIHVLCYSQSVIALRIGFVLHNIGCPVSFRTDVPAVQPVFILFYSSNTE